MSFDQSNKPIFRAAVVFLPQATCPIALGQVGQWRDSGDGLLKTRNADGTDSLGGSGGAGTLPTIAVAAATTAVLAGTPVYANGTLGEGATLEKATNGALPTQDGVTLAVGDLLLVKDQASALQNGIYEVTRVGAAGVKWLLTRSVLFDVAGKIKEGTLVIPTAGTANANLLFELTSASAPVVGTDDITFSQAVASVTYGLVGEMAAAGQAAANTVGVVNKSARVDHQHAQGKVIAAAAALAVADPGNAGAIAVTHSGVCPLVTAGAETRTLAIPTFLGQELVLQMKTDGGDGVVTSAQAINQAGNNTITFNDAGDAVGLVAIDVGGALRWRVRFNDGATLATV